MNVQIALDQIGHMNILAISGGRSKVNIVGDLVLPVGAGYSVEIHLAANNTYTVRRVRTRKLDRFVREITGVYADQLGSVAYHASCYSCTTFGELVAA